MKPWEADHLRRRAALGLVDAGWPIRDVAKALGLAEADVEGLMDDRRERLALLATLRTRRRAIGYRPGRRSNFS